MGRYMMATSAMSGGRIPADISREEPDLCYVDGEDGADWIGRWVEGFGFVNVRFPKRTTRDLTEEEIVRYDGKMLALWGNPEAPMGTIRITP